MRILHVIPTLNPQTGGPPVACASLAAAQAGVMGGGQGAGASVGILTYSHADGLGDAETKGETAAGLSKYSGLPGFSRVTVHTLPRPGRVERLLGRGARQLLREVVRGYDVVHIHGLWLAINYHAAAAALGAGKPYVIAPHGMLDTWALSEKPLKKKVALALGFRRLIARAAGLHALSTHERDCLLDGGFNKNPFILPNGVFLSDIDPPAQAGTFRGKHPEIGAEPFVFFLARLHPVKGLDLLTEALAKLSSRHPTLRLVCAGPDAGAAEPMRQQALALGVADRIHLLGAVYGRERFEAFADAACFALPSKHEGFSMSIAEAMASSCPVVITDTCNMPEVEQHGAGIVHARTAEALAEALDRMLSDAELRGRCGANGRGLIERQFTWPAIAGRSLEVYAALRG